MQVSHVFYVVVEEGHMFQEYWKNRSAKSSGALHVLVCQESQLFLKVEHLKVPTQTFTSPYISL